MDDRTCSRVARALRIAAVVLSGSKLETKRGRPTGTFYGDDSGTWRYTEGYPLGILREGWSWYASIALSSKNDWRNMSVEGATENNRGFRKALNAIVKKYPEVLDFTVSFDGPVKQVSDLVEGTAEVDLSKLTFYHGTTSLVRDAVMAEGLKPRRMTKSDPTFGSEFGAQPGRDDAIYLTTQEGMARSAAHSAVRNARQRLGNGGEPVILVIKGLDPRFAVPDEDSREQDPVKSLERLGSIAYTRPIPPRLIKRVIEV